MVLDNSLEMIKVKKIPNIITKITASVEIIEAPKPFMVPAMKIVAIVIRKGNLPIARNKVVG